MKTSSLVN